MTRARALKETIRARAVKTGERYTTARRHVLNERGTAPKPAIRFPSTITPVPAKARAADPVTKGGLSDAKTREKTGHGLDHWFDVLDRFGGAGKGHTALARHLFDDHSVPGWHSQGITVAYERARGIRAVNQRCDGEYEVSVSKVVTGRTTDVMKAITDARQRKRWTKDVDANLLKALTAAIAGSGSKKVVIRPDGLGRFRYKWGETTVQFYLTPKPADKVSVVVTNSKLADGAMVEARRAQWRAAVTALAQTLSRA